VLLETCSAAFVLRSGQDEVSERLAEISAGYRVDADALWPRAFRLRGISDGSHASRNLRRSRSGRRGAQS